MLYITKLEDDFYCLYSDKTKKGLMYNNKDKCFSSKFKSNNEKVVDSYPPLKHFLIDCIFTIWGSRENQTFFEPTVLGLIE